MTVVRVHLEERWSHTREGLGAKSISITWTNTKHPRLGHPVVVNNSTKVRSITAGKNGYQATHFEVEVPNARKKEGRQSEKMKKK